MDVGRRRVVPSIRRGAFCSVRGQRGLEEGNLGSTQEITDRLVGKKSNTKNELSSIQDPLLRTVGLAYDLAGRITTQTLPDTCTIGYSYNANGNVTNIMPPGMRSTWLMVGARDLKPILKR